VSIIKFFDFSFSHKKVRGEISFKVLFPVAILFGFSANPAQAHIIPVDFGIFDGAVVATTTEKNNGVSANFGWIDGTDADWGDTHKIATYTFSLTNQAANVTLSFRGKANAFGSAGMNPGFTLYQGLPAFGANLDHDFAIGSELIRTNACATMPGCTTTEGSLRSLTTFAITTDADPTGTNPNVFTYIGSSYDGTAISLPAANSPLQDGNPFVVPGADGLTNNTVTLLFSNLAPGAYTVFVGGTSYANQGSVANNASRGIGGTLTITPTAVPIPPAVWLFGSALTGLVGWSRRKPLQS